MPLEPFVHYGIFFIGIEMGIIHGAESRGKLNRMSKHTFYALLFNRKKEEDFLMFAEKQCEPQFYNTVHNLF